MRRKGPPAPLSGAKYFAELAQKRRDEPRDDIVSVIVHGKVQGVGYRVFARTCAEALGVRGWVRNNEDGTVDAHAEGSPQQLEEFAFDLSRGARYARVARIERLDAEVGAGNAALEGFEIRR